MMKKQPYPLQVQLKPASNADFEIRYSKYLNFGIIVFAITVSVLIAYLLVFVSPLVAILGLIGIPLILFLYLHPKIGMMIVIFILPLEELNIRGGFSSIKLISVVVFGCAILNYIILNRSKPLIRNSYTLLIGVFVLVALISVFVAYSPERTLSRLPKLLRIITLFYFCINLLKSEQDLRIAFWVFVLGGFVSTLYGFFDPTLVDGRFEGTLGQPNGYAAVTLTRIPIALSLYMTENQNWKKIILIALALLPTYGIILSASRGGLIGLLVGLITFVIVQRNRSRWVIIFCGLLVVGYAVMPLSVKDRVGLTGKSTSSNEGNSIDRRLTYQIYGLELFKEYPVLGIGLDGFAEAYAQSEYRFMIRTQSLRMAHNTYLEIATGTGFIGLFSFISILGLSLYYPLNYCRIKYWKKNKRVSELARGLVGAIAGFYVVMLFGSYQYEKTLWLLIGFSSMLQNIFVPHHKLVYDDSSDGLISVASNSR